jgi:hypothetical protein
MPAVFQTAAFAVISLWGKFGDLALRSHIVAPRSTTKLFAKSFVFKTNGAKEGLRKDNPSGLGAGGPEFKSRRPDHFQQGNESYGLWAEDFFGECGAREAFHAFVLSMMYFL